MARTVAEIMNRELLGIRPGERRQNVVDALAAFGVSAVPVLDAERRPIAMLSAKDLLREEEPSPNAPVDTVAPDATIQAAAERMAETGHHELVVVDAAGHAVGIVSTLDVVRGLIGHPTPHPASFPHQDALYGVTWSDDVPLRADRASVAHDGPGVLVLVYGRAGSEESVVWAGACANVRARLDDLLTLPQDDPLLARVLARGDLRFRVARVLDDARARGIAARIAETARLGHLPLPHDVVA